MNEEYPRTTLTRSQRITLWAFTILLLIPAGYGFVVKIIQFLVTLGSGGEGSFTILPLTTYFLVALGMLCLLLWGTLNGMFRNIEKPKYTMLEREDWLDRNEERELS